MWDVSLFVGFGITAINSYTGTTRVEAGTLRITGGQSLSDTAELTVFAGAKMDVDSGSERVGSLVLRDSEGIDTVQPFGTYGAPDSGAETEVPGWTGGGVILVSTDPYAAWIAGFVGFNNLTFADRQKFADPDRDGATNLTEFALDGNPLSGITSGKIRSRLETVGANQALVLTIPVRADAVFTGAPSKSATITEEFVTYTIEGSNTLETFDQGVSEISVIDEESLPPLNFGWIYKSFRLDGAIGGATPRGPAGFLHVGITEEFP